MDKKICPICGKEQMVKYARKTEDFQVRDEKIRATITVCVCAVCGEEIWDSSLEEKNEKIVFDLFRKKKNLVSPDEIKEIRKQYGLSAAAFSLLLGFGEKTVTRYETGFLPDQSHSLLIRLMKSRFCFKKVWTARKGVLSPQEVEKIEANLRDAFFSDPQEIQDWFSEIRMDVQSREKAVFWSPQISYSFLGDLDPTQKKSEDLKKEESTWNPNA